MFVDSETLFYMATINKVMWKFAQISIPLRVRWFLLSILLQHYKISNQRVMEHLKYYRCKIYVFCPWHFFIEECQPHIFFGAIALYREHLSNLANEQTWIRHWFVFWSDPSSKSHTLDARAAMRLAPQFFNAQCIGFLLLVRKAETTHRMLITYAHWTVDNAPSTIYNTPDHVYKVTFRPINYSCNFVYLTRLA